MLRLSRDEQGSLASTEFVPTGLVQDCEFYVLEKTAFDELLKSTVKDSMDALHSGMSSMGGKLIFILPPRPLFFE